MKDTIVVYPSAIHLVTVVELAKLIATHYSDSLSVIVIIPHAPSFHAASHLAAAAFPSITFRHLPAVPDSAAISVPATTPSAKPLLTFRYVLLNNPNLREALLDISASPSHNLKAIILDFFSNPARRVADDLNIPAYYYFTNSAAGLALFLYIPTLYEADETDDQQVKLGYALGLPPVPEEDIMSLTVDKTSEVYDFFVDIGVQMAKSAGLIVNTFQRFQETTVNALLEGRCVPGGSIPPVYCVGPIVNTSPNHESGGDHACLRWLDSQPCGSVVYLSFGRWGAFSAEQVREMASGLERSGARFLWVVREPPPAEDRDQISGGEPWCHFLPEGFVERTKERGFVVDSWAPQRAVLSHEAVGGFVTHCGWNSVLEAVCAGVPMLAWPLYAEQRLNRHVIVEGVKVSLAVESVNEFVSACELERRVKELMESEKGMAVRRQVLAMKDAAVAARSSEGGSSRIGLANLVRSILDEYEKV